MIASMSKKPQKPKQEPQKQLTIYLRPDEQTAAALTLFVGRQPVPPKYTDVVTTALHEFLAKHGCWPIEKD